MKIAVVCDSTSGIYDLKEDIKHLYKLPIQMNCEDKTYLEGEDIDRQMAFDMLRDNKVFTTSLPPLGRIEELFNKLKADGYDMVYLLAISPGLSGTFDAIRMGAEMVGIDFSYFDLSSAASLVLHYAKAALEMFEKGFSVDEVSKRLEEAKQYTATFLVADDLKHLHRSGRLSSAASILAGMLRIKPVLYLGKDSSGELTPVAKPRTLKRALENIVDNLEKAGLDDDSDVFILHVENIKMAELLKEMIVSKYKNVRIQIDEIVAAVGIHVGLGGVGAQFTRKIRVS